MTETVYLKIHEIFHSIQGESTHMGRPCIFVRLTGCDLRCTWCDTEYAFYEGEKNSIEEILETVAGWPTKLVEITGGEPLLQKNVYPLMEQLLERGYELMIETGGHISTEQVPDAAKIILDVKCPGSGEMEKNHYPNLERLRSHDEVKFVVRDRADFDWATEKVREYDLAARVPVHFSPVFGELNYEKLANWILESGLSIRFQNQLHKHIWDPTTRGV